MRFTLPKAGRIEIDLFSVTGQRVGRIASGWFEAGEHAVPWRGMGATLANGIYFVRLRGEDVNLTQKLVVAN